MALIQSRLTDQDHQLLPQCRVSNADALFRDRHISGQRRQLQQRLRLLDKGLDPRRPPAQKLTQQRHR